MTIKEINPPPRSTKVPRARVRPRPAADKAPSATAQANASREPARRCPVCGEKSRTFIKVSVGFFDKEICTACATTGQQLVTVLGRLFG